MFTYIIFTECIYFVFIKLFFILLLFIDVSNITSNWISYPSSPKYDYLIVGCGTAGSLISHRLATETNYTFAVLEAGGYGHSLLDIPVLGPLLQGSAFDWQYETVPQANACLSMNDRKCRWPMGRMFGGTSRFNNMIHMRGDIKQYVDWFQGLYDLEYMQKQFDKIEKDILPVSRVSHRTKLGNAILEAAYELGYRIGNLNKDLMTGFMESQVNQKDGSRWGTYKTFGHNENRNIITNALVNRVLLNKNGIAYGVEYFQGSKLRRVKAMRGVILASGVIGTPKLLMLSGIGPEDHLREIGIKTIRNLPVGKNLQDHITTGFDLITLNETLSVTTVSLLNPISAYEYFINGKGPWTSPGCEVVALFDTKQSNTSDNITRSPDLQFMVLPVGVTSDMGVHLKSSVGLTDRAWDKYFSNLIHNQTITILPILLHPKSTGELKLQSKNPADKPLIDPKYLTVEEDLDVIVKGIQIVKKLIETDALKKMNAQFYKRSYPGCEQLLFDSCEYWKCYIRHLTLTSFHPFGTCKMGPKDSKNSVVDSNFKVLGIANLFVADASVFPTPPGGNINAVVALMANIFFDSQIMEQQVCLKPKYFFKIKLN